MKLRTINTGFPRINYAFLLVIATVIVNVAFNYYLIRKSRASIAEMTGSIQPYVEALNEFNLMVTESKMYATNWVYLQNSVEDKEKLKDLHQHRFRALKRKLEELAARRGKKEDAQSLARVFSGFNELINVETGIMNTLVTFDDYENPQKKFEAEDMIESEVLPRTQEIMALLGGIISRNQAEAAALTEEIESDTRRMMKTMLAASLVLLVFILVSVYFITQSIRRPVQRMKQIIYSLSRGAMIREQLRAGDDAVGEMVKAVNALSASLGRTSAFADEIRKGNLTVPYEKLSDEDMLGNALIKMRESLRAYSEDMEAKVREHTEEVMEKTRKLEHAYKEIRDSINYARRIQESILPSGRMIADAFPDHFIFYRPKDVVCGDFYWFGKRDKDVVIAAIDCTGHGVPGALMTVIGNSLLNQIVTFSGVTSPSEILRQLDNKLHDTLKQHGGNVTSDGMDMAICHYVMGEKKLTFAGARRPLYLVRGDRISEIKGSKAPIGSYVQGVQKNFVEHQVPVHAKDRVYLFSDGLQDQFGGNQGKKFMISRLRDLLLAVQALAMPKQKDIIENELKGWQGDQEQTDDMLLIGIGF
jgi:serine phosphatase RsbU (regulator of sigma subunit)